MEAQFPYKLLDLKPESRDIRFLTLLPAISFDEKIRCTVFHGSLESPPSYQALSYVWGTEPEKLEIDLAYHPTQVKAGSSVVDQDNDTPSASSFIPFYVTPNLESALRHIRDPRSPLILWIDAVCIDQHSSDEKNHQVAQMRQVYLKAQTVIMWLGPELNHSNSLAISFLRSMPDEIDGGTPYVFHLDDTAAWFACDELFLQRPYWRRSWILQEILHDRPVTVHVGTHALGIDEFFGLFRKYFSLRKALSSLTMSGLTAEDQRNLSQNPGQDRDVLIDVWFRAAGTAESMPDSLVDMRPLFQDTEYQPRLGYMLYKFRDQGVTVAKDKIYSLQGMVKREYEIEINYNEDASKGSCLSTRDLYTRTTRQLLSRVLVVLLWIESPQRKIESGLDGVTLPSWVPDFMTEQHLSARCLHSTSTLFCAAKDFPLEVAKELDATKRGTEKDSGIFTIRGVRVARITHMKEVHATKNWSDDEAAKGWDQVKLFWYDRMEYCDGDYRTLETSLPVPDSVLSTASFENTSWGPCKAEPQDIIVVAAGSNIPLVLREESNRFLFVGGCWLVNSTIDVWALKPSTTGLITKHDGFDDIMFGGAIGEIGKSHIVEEFQLC